MIQASFLLSLDHLCEPAQARPTAARACELLARDDDTETVFHRHHHSEQDDRRKGNDVIQQFIFVTVNNGRSQRRVWCGFNYQLAQLSNGFRGVYGFLRPAICTSCGPSLLTGMGETGSASGKNRSSLCR